MTPTTVAGWVAAGDLPAPPWTGEELLTVRDRRSTVVRRRGTSAAHGTERRWSVGCDCPDCRAAHRLVVSDREHAQADGRFPPDLRRQLIDLLTSGVLFGAAVRQLGLSAATVWGRRQWDSDWATELTVTLDTFRPAGLDHGHEQGYRAGCRCSQCRLAANPHTKA